MNATYRNAIRDHGKTLISHIGLYDDQGNELTGGDPAYARKEVTWVDDGDGTMRPNADIEFDIPADTTVSGWRGYDALTVGTDYDGAAFAAAETFASQGTLTLLAASTGVLHNAG